MLLALPAPASQPRFTGKPIGLANFRGRLLLGRPPWPFAFAPASYEIEITGLPNTSQRGATPSPGAWGAAIRPFFRRGAPSAVLTVT